MKKIIIAYVPVLHKGYLNFFKKCEGSELFLLGEDITSDYKYLVKDIRALNSNDARKLIKALASFSKVEILTKTNIAKIKSRAVIFMPNDEVCIEVKNTYFKICSKTNKPEQ